MDILINSFIVALPFLTVALSLLLGWLFYLRKLFTLKHLIYTEGVLLLLIIFQVVNSPLVRPTITEGVNEAVISQLEMEADNIEDIDELILKDLVPETEVKTEFKEYTPSLD